MGLHLYTFVHICTRGGLYKALPPVGWTFSCSCPSYAEPPEICKHIGVCLIVHFYVPPDKDSKDGDCDEDYEEDYYRDCDGE